MKIYRIENPETNSGMWYNECGEFEPFIETLTDGKCADLPMDWHERYGRDGVRWFSGCNNLEDLKGWFSHQDAKELIDAGYSLFVFECDEYSVEETQTLFTREGVISKNTMSIEEVWGL